MDEVTPETLVDTTETRVILSRGAALFVGILVGVGVGIAVAAALTAVAKEYGDVPRAASVVVDDEPEVASIVIVED